MHGNGADVRPQVARVRMHQRVAGLPMEALLASEAQLLIQRLAYERVRKGIPCSFLAEHACTNRVLERVKEGAAVQATHR